MDKTVLFWIVLGSLGFAFVLAVQMRVITAMVLRRALKAWRPALEDRLKANQAVILAAAATPVPGDTDTDIADAAAHLRSVYPMPLGHLRTARRYSILLPILLLGLLGLGRLVLGVI